jgi:hypothetical protein
MEMVRGSGRFSPVSAPVGQRWAFNTGLESIALRTSGVEAGDAICIITGVTTPFIIRKLKAETETASKYLLVGECYTHGVLNGKN